MPSSPWPTDTLILHAMIRNDILNAPHPSTQPPAAAWHTT